MQANTPSDSPDAKPFLELGEDVPADWQYHSPVSPTSSSSEWPTSSSSEWPTSSSSEWPTSSSSEWPTPNPSAGDSLFSEVPTRPLSRRWTYTRPSWPQLLGLTAGLVVILALMPQLLGIVGISLRVLLLTLRVLALPLLALGLAWWGWQLWQYRIR
ncbi:MAG: hypothetical protein ACO1RX_21120 [Candidatus Sericytochromatia bacterium]